jgi:hypothetical protein
MHATTPTHRAEPGARHRRRRSTTVAAVAAGFALLLAACQAPAPPAGKLFDAWKAGNRTQAAATATPTAVDQIFAKAYTWSSGWFFNQCDGVAGSTYCTWIDNTEGRLELRIDNASNKVVAVKRIALGNINAGRFFHAWRFGTEADAAPYGTNDAVNDMFSVAYTADTHWSPAGCDPAGAFTYCNWYDDESNAIVLKVDNATQKVFFVDRGVVD